MSSTLSTVTNDADGATPGTNGILIPTHIDNTAIKYPASIPTHTVVTVEGAMFAAHRLVLAAACSYFERHYDHEPMRDADNPKLLEHVTAAAFEPLLAFLSRQTTTVA